jgi:hypothetical protein
MRQVSLLKGDEFDLPDFAGLRLQVPNQGSGWRPTKARGVVTRTASRAVRVTERVRRRMESKHRTLRVTCQQAMDFEVGINYHSGKIMVSALLRVLQALG